MFDNRSKTKDASIVWSACSWQIWRILGNLRGLGMIDCKESELANCKFVDWNSLQSGPHHQLTIAQSPQPVHSRIQPWPASSPLHRLTSCWELGLEVDLWELLKDLSKIWAKTKNLHPPKISLDSFSLSLLPWQFPVPAVSPALRTAGRQISLIIAVLSNCDWWEHHWWALLFPSTALPAPLARYWSAGSLRVHSDQTTLWLSKRLSPRPNSRPDYCGSL